MVRGVRGGGTGLLRVDAALGLSAQVFIAPESVNGFSQAILIEFGPEALGGSDLGRGTFRRREGSGLPAASTDEQIHRLHRFIRQIIHPIRETADGKAQMKPGAASRELRSEMDGA